MRLSGAMTLTALVTVSLAVPLPVPKTGRLDKRFLMKIADFVADNKSEIDGLGKLISSVVPKKKKELPEASEYPAAGKQAAAVTNPTGTTFGSTTGSKGIAGSYSDRSYQALPGSLSTGTSGTSGTTNPGTLDPMNDYGTLPGSSYAYANTANDMYSGSGSGDDSASMYSGSGSGDDSASMYGSLGGSGSQTKDTSGGSNFDYTLPSTGGSVGSVPPQAPPPINNCGRGGSAGVSFGCSGGTTASTVVQSPSGARAIAGAGSPYDYSGGGGMPNDPSTGGGAGGMAGGAALMAGGAGGASYV